tara:strand:+ start:543 stop:794 length:252 start_codon:yes stop_codon:yes gene_type:complete
MNNLVSVKQTPRCRAQMLHSVQHGRWFFAGNIISGNDSIPSRHLVFAGGDDHLEHGTYTILSGLVAFLIRSLLDKLVSGLFGH